MFTKQQEKQLEFLDAMESRESLGDERKYLCQCRTCKKQEFLSSAGTVSALFMNEHAGHDTWVRLLKGA